jgi:hypothetical protein
MRLAVHSRRTPCSASQITLQCSSYNLLRRVSLIAGNSRLEDDQFGCAWIAIAAGVLLACDAILNSWKNAAASLVQRAQGSHLSNGIERFSGG